MNSGVLTERALYYTILVEGVRTIREGLLIEECALPEVVRYVYDRPLVVDFETTDQRNCLNFCLYDRI